MEDEVDEEEGVDNEEEDEEDDDEDESLDEEEQQDVVPDKITSDAERNDESLPQPVGWSGSMMPLRFISGKSIIDANTLEISGLPSGGFSSVGTKGVVREEFGRHSFRFISCLDRNTNQFSLYFCHRCCALESGTTNAPSRQRGVYRSVLQTVLLPGRPIPTGATGVVVRRQT